MNTGRLCLTRPLVRVTSLLLLLKCECVSRLPQPLLSIPFPPLWDGASPLGMAYGDSSRVDRQSLNL